MCFRTCLYGPPREETNHAANSLDTQSRDRSGEPASAEEQKELRRVFQEGYARKLSVGTVHAYVLAPDGHLLDSRHVEQASRTEDLLALLDGTIRTLGTQPGEPLVTPVPQAAVPAKPGELLIHTQAHRFKAASFGAGVSNGISQTGTTDIPSARLNYFGAWPWDERER